MFADETASRARAIHNHRERILMRKRTTLDDSTEPEEGEGSATRRFEPRSQHASPESDLVACPSITLPIDSHFDEDTKPLEEKPLVVDGVFGVDWFQLAACVDWTPEISSPHFET